jgi:hypothetical protein
VRVVSFLAHRPVYFKYGTFAPRWALENSSNLRGVQLELGHGAAQGIAVHSEFLSRLALVALVMRKHFQQKAPFEFAHCFGVGDAACVHLTHEVIQFTFHRVPLFNAPEFTRVEFGLEQQNPRGKGIAEMQWLKASAIQAEHFVL